MAATPPTSPPETQSELQPVPQTAKLALFWSVGGNGLYVASQFIILMIITRLTSADELGRYGLGLAITGPVFILAYLGLRTGQATDTARHFSFERYLKLRHLANIAACIVLLAIAPVLSPDTSAFYVILVLTISRIAESYSDLFYGVFQKHHRLDLMGRSMILRGVLSATLFGVLLWYTRQLAVALFAQVIVWSVFAYFHDRHYARKLLGALEGPTTKQKPGTIYSLLRLSFPFGFGALLGSLIYTLPRFIVEDFLGLAALGQFTAVAYAFVAGQYLAIAIDQTFLARVAQHMSAHQFRSALRLVLTITGGLVTMGTGGVIVSYFFGGPILHIIYGPEYAESAQLLTLLLLAMTLTFFAITAQNFQTAMRKFRLFAIIQALVAPVSFGLTYWGAQSAGMMGIGWGIVGTAFVHAALCIGLTWWAFLTQKRQAATTIPLDNGPTAP